MDPDQNQQQKIMITRPAHQAGSLINSVHSAGGQSLSFPTIEIQPVASTHLRPARNIDDYDIIIFISPNAVKYGLNFFMLDKTLPLKPLLATVGLGSARELEKATGKKPDIVPTSSYTSEGLLEHPLLQEISNKNILLVKGQGGRDLLLQTLTHRGGKVEELIVYHRKTPDIDTTQAMQDLQNNLIAAIVITSGDALKNLVSMTPDEYHKYLLKIPLVLINERIQHIAEQLGFTGPCYLSESAADEKITGTLLQHGIINTDYQN